MARENSIDFQSSLVVLNSKKIMKINSRLDQATSRKMNLLAVIFLIAILVADWLTPFVTITPPLTLIAIGFLALKLPPRRLLIWGLSYATAATLMIYYDRHNWNPVNGDLRLVTRIAGVFAGQAVAFGLSIYRVQLEKSYFQMLDLFQHIPSALIVSDSLGNIVRVNRRAAELCQFDETRIIGDSYFKYFGISASKGGSVRKYLEVVQNSAAAVDITEIYVVSRELIVPGSIQSLDVSQGSERWILTILDAAKPTGGTLGAAAVLEKK